MGQELIQSIFHRKEVILLIPGAALIVPVQCLLMINGESRSVRYTGSSIPDTEKQIKTEFTRITTSDGLFNLPDNNNISVRISILQKNTLLSSLSMAVRIQRIYITAGQGTIHPGMPGTELSRFTVDHRGSGQFGSRGNDYLHRNLGKWEILDYADAVKWLLTKHMLTDSRK